MKNNIYNTLHILFAALMVAIFPVGLAAKQNPIVLGKEQISNVKIDRTTSALQISFVIHPKKIQLSYNRQLTVVPVILSNDSKDSIPLQAVVVGGKNAYYNFLRNNDDTALETDEILLRSGYGESVRYIRDVAWQEWMTHSRLKFRVQETGCCRQLKGVNNEDVALMDWRTPRFEPKFIYQVPTGQTSKQRRIEGRAYVSFPVNRTEIYPDYMINPAELRKITNSIDTVRMNRDATVKSITLHGYASPEGPYDNNVRLAKGRTEAVKEYVRRQYDFPKSVFHTNSTPEDWAGLRDSVAVSILPDRNEILAFIDNGGVKIEQRNDQLRKRFSKSYSYLLKNVYPWLRHTDYAIDYEIRTYTDLEEILRVLRENPSNLSLNEFFIAANSYPDGSEQANDVWNTAVTYNPGSAIANLNAANVSMREGDYARARMLLSRITDQSSAEYPLAQYALGVLEALQDNYLAALGCFDNARSLGVAEATAAIDQIHALQTAPPVQTIEPFKE